ncbi:MAG: hypothetical protein NTX25_08180, partial [Proteobacteria bacterium]|nr:hypothetical protein [Pseudomonadota bacterium]
MKQLAMALISTIFFTACTKENSSNDDSGSDPGTVTTETPASTPGTLSVELSKPVAVLDATQRSMASTMDTDIANSMVGTLALPSLLRTGFTLDDCDEHAKPKARSGDSNFDETHPRWAIQEFYCKMNKDTFAADSFLGALTESRLLPCILGEGLVFDGEEHSLNITKAIFQPCLGSNLSQAKKDEITPDFSTTTLLMKYIPKRLDEALTAGHWDVSIKLSLTVNGNLAFEEE